MSGTVNKVILIGHTGDEIKMHYFDDKNCVGSVSLATNESYTNKQTNERVTSTEWHNLKFRNKGAEIAEKYVRKGDKLYIEGRIKTRKWTDDKGIDRYSTEIIVFDFKMLTSKADREQNTHMREPQPQQPRVADPNKPFETGNGDDDLPF